MHCSFRLLSVLLLGVSILAGCSSRVPAQDSGGALLPEQAAYDVTHYDLAVQPYPSQKRIEGRLTVRAAVRDSIDVFVLNLDRRLDVERAWSHRSGQASELRVQRRANENQLWIALKQSRTPGESIEVSVEYEGVPRTAPNPPWEGGLTWDTTANGAPWIGTSCQTAGADLWWPMKDHPSDEPDSMDVAITVPRPLVAASNGVLRSVDRTTDSTQTYRWHVSTPVNPYTVTMNVAPYARIDTTYRSVAGGAVPVTFFALPEDRSRAKNALPQFLDHVRFLERTLGPYPFRADKYGIAQTPFLGMEHQSLIAYGHDFSHGGLGYDAPFDALHFHELAHEWYGNLVTVEDWKDFWLHEGTATYLEALYAESLRGDSAYHAVTRHHRRQLEGERAIARRSPTTARSIYHGDVYYRGAQTLHTLRYVSGEDAIREILRRFVYPDGAGQNDQPPFRSVTTADFVEVAEEVTGRSLQAFFDVYLYQPGLPELTVDRSGGSLELRWSNTGGVPFEVPVPVSVDGRVHRVEMSDGTGRLEVPAGEEIEIDPQGWILRAE